MKKKSIFLGLPLALFALTACEDEPEEFLISPAIPWKWK